MKNGEKITAVRVGDRVLECTADELVDASGVEVARKAHGSNVKWLDRAVACVNACEGFDNPAETISSIVGAARLAERWIRLGDDDDLDGPRVLDEFVLHELRAALMLVGGQDGES